MCRRGSFYASLRNGLATNGKHARMFHRANLAFHLTFHMLPTNF